MERKDSTPKSKKDQKCSQLYAPRAASFNSMPNHIKKQKKFSNPGKKGSVTIIYVEIGMCQGCMPGGRIALVTAAEEVIDFAINSV